MMPVNGAFADGIKSRGIEEKVVIM